MPGYSGAGVVVSDGVYLYVRAWYTYAGPTMWRKVGSGFGGTSAGQDYGSVGPSFSTLPILSAALVGDKIYNGYAVTASSVTAVSKTTGSTSTLAFKTSTGTAKPLLSRSTGSNLTAATYSTLLAADNARFYSVAYGRGGTSLAGWTIREFTSAGVFVADHLIGSSSYYIDSALSDGTYLYLIQGGSNKVTKVRLSDWTVAQAWTPGWVSSGEISGCYDTVNSVFWLGALSQGNVYRFCGGLDLRDDPSALFARTAGGRTAPAYDFKVIATDAAGKQTPWATQPTTTVQFAARTLASNEAIAHTVHDLGSIAGDEAEALLDVGVMRMSTADLAIDSFGPSAVLSRTYRSDVTSATLFAAGWRFGFEQSIGVGGSSSRVYTDAGGDTFCFTPVGTNTWAAPHSMVATLTWSPASSTYALLLKGGVTLTFDGAGRLSAETDRHGLSVTYAWTGPGMVITAANGQQIKVTISGSPSRVATAEYAAGGVTRSATYASSASSGAVTKMLSDAESLEVDYTYANSVLATVSVPAFKPGSVNAAWGFSYNAGWLTGVAYPSAGSSRTLTIAADVAGRFATVSRRARVGLNGTDTLVSETHTWDPTKREVSCTVPGESGATLTDYAASGAVRHSVSAAGVISDSVTDSRGNELLSWDVDHHLTTNVYNATDDLVMSTDPKGSVTAYTVNGVGDVTLERRTLNGTDSAETSRTFDAQGRVLTEARLIDASTGTRSYTTYADYGNFNEAGTVTQIGVPLTTGGTGVDLQTRRTFDAFGQLLTETDPANSPTVADSYDTSGRLVSETDAAGAVTHHRYDVLGHEVETSRTADGVWSDWTIKTIDPTGLVLSEQSYVSAGGVPSVYKTVTHSYDGSGQELSAAASNEGTTTTRYDAKGDVAQSWTPSAESTATFDGTVTKTDADGRTTAEAGPAYGWQVSTQATATTTYDDGSVEVTATQSIEQTGSVSTTYTYDEAGNQTQVHAPAAGVGSVTTSSTYDVGGRLVASEDASGDIVYTNYDLLDRVVSTSLDVAGGPRVTSSTYNSAGWLLSSTDADGVTTTREYDRDGRAVKETVTRGDAPAQITQHAFDTSGREITTIDPDGWVIDTTYDGFGRALRRAQHLGAAQPVHDVGTAYDEAGRAIETSDAAIGLATTCHYATSATDTIRTVRTLADTTLTVEASAAGVEIGRYLEVGSGSDVATLNIGVTGRDAAQRPVEWQYAGGVSQTSRKFLDGQGRPWFDMSMGTAGYYYDVRTGQKNRDTVSSRDTTYTYTDEGRLATATSGTDVRTYGYDAAGQITQAAGTNLSYSGGRLSATAVGSDVTTYTFDSRGRRTGQSSASAQIAYGWSAGDRLTSYSLDRAPFGSPDVTATFTYDGAGQRTGSVVTSVGVTTTTGYVYEGLQLAQLVSTTGSNVTTITYVYDEQGKAQALTIKVTGTPKPYVLPIWTSDRGDVGFVGGNYASNAVGYSYDPYGRPLTQTVSGGSVPPAVAQKIADIQPLRYAGYAYDAFSGLYYCSQRYYDPATCQFISRDPALSDAEESAYQYCGGDPVGKRDPSGQVSVWVPGVKQPDGFNWCWAASAVSVLKAMHRGAGVTMQKFVRLAFPWGGTRESLWGIPGHVQFGLARCGVASYWHWGPPAWSQIYLSIAMGRPVLAYIAWTHSRGAHVVVLYRMTLFTHTVSWMDPAYGSKGNSAQYETNFIWNRDGGSTRGFVMFGAIFPV